MDLDSILLIGCSALVGISMADEVNSDSLRRKMQKSGRFTLEAMQYYTGLKTSKKITELVGAPDTYDKLYVISPEEFQSIEFSSKLRGINRPAFNLLSLLGCILVFTFACLQYGYLWSVMGIVVGYGLCIGLWDFFMSKGVEDELDFTGDLDDIESPTVDEFRDYFMKSLDYAIAFSHRKHRSWFDKWLMRYVYPSVDSIKENVKELIEFASARDSAKAYLDEVQFRISLYVGDERYKDEMPYLLDIESQLIRELEK